MRGNRAMRHMLFKVLLIPLSVLFIMSIFTAVSHSQLGEVAGYLNYVIQVGHNQTLQLTLVNGGNQTIGVMMQPPNHFTLISPSGTDANQVLPTIVSITPQNFIIPPHSFYKVNITIFMPLRNTPRLAAWEGIMSAQEVQNQTNGGGGAAILEGVAKVFTITSIPSTTTTTISTTIITSPLSAIGSPTSIVLGLLVVAGVVILYYSSKGKKLKRGKGRGKGNGRGKGSGRKAKLARKKAVGRSKKARKKAKRRRK